MHRIPLYSIQKKRLGLYILIWNHILKKIIAFKKMKCSMTCRVCVKFQESRIDSSRLAHTQTISGRIYETGWQPAVVASRRVRGCMKVRSSKETYFYYSWKCISYWRKHDLKQHIWRKVMLTNNRSSFCNLLPSPMCLLNRIL